MNKTVELDSKLKLSPKESRALKYLREKGSITQDQARKDLGDARLAVTISGLRRKGFDIPCHRVDIQNRYEEPTWYGRYTLNEG